MKNLSYLQAFSPKILREARRIICKGFTAEDIDRFLGKQVQFKHTWKLPQRNKKGVFSKLSVSLHS